MRTTEQKADILWRRRNLSSSGTGVDLSTATGILAIAKGGTGATSAPAALTSLGAYPATNPSGFTSNLGTVTSVAASVPAFLSIAGSPITTSGTLAITYSGTALPVANGGTGITSFGTGVATWLGTPSSANLAAAITDETGSGALVFGTSPTIASPTITGTGTAAFGNLSYTGTLTGNGLTFPATQVPSANANTLDDYEEGTFTPTIVGTTTAGTGTYTTQVGTYTKIGRLVHAKVALTWTAHTGTGNLQINGLPFTPGAGGLGRSVGSLQIANIVYTGTHLQAYVFDSSTSISLAQVSSGAAEAGIAMDTSATVYVTVAYEV
jgi:hypothetical protein